MPCDAEDYESLSRLFDEHRFAAILNCAGNCGGGSMGHGKGAKPPDFVVVVIAETDVSAAT